jgi:hypothetical protein
VIIFGSVFIKKKLKPNRNRFKLAGFDSIRFGFLGQKPVWLGFFGLARFGPVLAWFFPVFFNFGSDRFAFFSFRLIKLKPNQTGRFF